MRCYTLVHTHRYWQLCVTDCGGRGGCRHISDTLVTYFSFSSTLCLSHAQTHSSHYFSMSPAPRGHTDSSGFINICWFQWALSIPVKHSFSMDGWYWFCSCQAFEQTCSWVWIGAGECGVTGVWHSEHGQSGLVLPHGIEGRGGSVECLWQVVNGFNGVTDELGSERRLMVTADISLSAL